MNRKPYDPDTGRMELAGRWAGYGFGRAGCLYTPENHEIQPQDLCWLSLTVALGNEWKRLMDAEKAHRRPPPVSSETVYLREVLAGARERLRACG
ncbi:MAG: hypothetical protein QM599_07370 [Pseudoxanthomonas sp.]